MLGIYTRLSKEDEESTSIANQLREGKEFAEAYNYKDYEEYNEGEGVSGTLDISQRPVFSKLVNDILQGKLTTVWFRNQNRLERNSLTFHLFLDACRKTSTKIYHGDQEFNYNDPNQLLTSSILSNLNAYSAQLQSVQTKKVLKSRTEQGKVHGMPAYGYEKDKDGYLVINNEEAEIVKLIYSLSLKGQGYERIAKHLNEKGVKTRYAQLGKGTYNHKDKFTGEITTFNKKDSKWVGGTVSGIIKNSLYKGHRIWGGEIYPAPTIIPSENWKKVQENLVSNRNNSGKKVEHKYLLRGLIRCGRCGRNYAGRSRVNKKDHYYQCTSKRTNSCGNKSINIDRLEEYIWFQLFLNNGIKDQIVAEYSDNNNEERLAKYENQLVQLQRKKVSIENKIDNALDLLIEGPASKALLKKKISSYENSIKNINVEIEAVEENISKHKNAQHIIDEYQNEFRKLNKITTFKEKKEIVNKYIRKITILSEGQARYMKIEFNIDIPPRGGLYTPQMGVLMPSSLDHQYVEKIEGLQLPQ